MKYIEQKKKEYEDIFGVAYQMTEDGSKLVTEVSYVTTDRIWNFIEDTIKETLLMAKEKTMLKHGFCRVCGEKTDIVFNIKLKATSICEDCARSIAHQEIEDMFYQRRIQL